MALKFNSGAAIVGIGSTDFVRGSARTAMSLAAEAFKAALADAYLSVADVDGLVTHYGVPLGVDLDRFSEALGINVRAAAQYWRHGRFVTTALQNAALTVMAGLADVVACVTAAKFTDRRESLGGNADQENAREAGGSHGEEPAVGLTAPVGGAALAFQRYCAVHAVDPGLLYYTVAAARLHAERNPRAIHRKPISAEAYAAEPLIIEPLRRADCAPFSDGAVVALVTTTERARELGRKAAYLKGMQGMRAGRDEFVFAPRGLGVRQQGLAAQPERAPNQAYAMAGVQAEDIDAVYTYDPFSPLIPYVLERFGHCAPGRGMHMAADGITAPGGRLPMNTSGGLIAEAHVAGWNCIAEIVRQVRGEAGPTQLARADHLQWATSWGDAIIFGPEP